MVTKKDLITAVLLTFCLTTVLLTVAPTRSAPGVGEYDPWCDVNDDGIINIFDVVALTSRYAKTGTPTTKASIEYDSGWINITGKQGQYITVTHGLNITDWNSENIVVEVTGKAGSDGELLRIGQNMPVLEWNRTYGGANDDVGNSVISTSDGGYALAGYTYSYGAGYQDFWLVKTDASGNAQWNKTYGGTYAEEARSIVQTSDGGYALVGWTDSFGAGLSDAYLVKTDALGNAQWSRTYGEANYEQGSSIVETSDGGYALAGDTSVYAGTADAYFVKTEVELGLAWTDSTADTLTLYRGAIDPYWNFVRVRIWKPKTP